MYVITPQTLGANKFGDVVGGNYAEFEADGTLVFHGDARVWDDLEGPMLTSRPESPSSDVVINLVDLTMDFKTSARYPTDYATYSKQMRHRYDPTTQIDLHLHWIQNSADIPNWLILWRVHYNGAAPGAWSSPVKWDSHIFTYPGSGDFGQITEFGYITAVNNISFGVDVLVYRDYTNVSTLFAGTDQHAGIAQAKFFDCHFVNNKLGSREEYTY